MQWIHFQVTSSLLLKDFGSDEDVHLDNLDLSSAAADLWSKKLWFWMVLEVRDGNPLSNLTQQLS